MPSLPSGVINLPHTPYRASVIESIHRVDNGEVTGFTSSYSWTNHFIHYNKFHCKRFVLEEYKQECQIYVIRTMPLVVIRESVINKEILSPALHHVPKAETS